MTENEKNKMAVLIDSENVSSKNIEFIMKESIRHGFLTIKRIYGDWTDQRMTSWKKVLPDYAIQPIQQFKNTQGKNSTDSALIIDAMDILYTSEVDGFIIVSSDSDYTKLAVRLRESGKVVVGIGEQKTPKSLVNACNEFRYIEILEKNFEGIKKELTQKNTKSEDTKKEDDELLQHLIEAYEMIEQESEWKNLSSVANNLKRLDPAFTPRTYGFGRLSHLMESYSKIFELRKDPRHRIIKVRKLQDEDVAKRRKRRHRPRSRYNNNKNVSETVNVTEVQTGNIEQTNVEKNDFDKKLGFWSLFGTGSKKD
ncbi:MAG: NYN domain-containing protein [Spirochaetales bacterium]|nr:NYN domain-containing protein [Spirochaetales bacterium]MEE1291517.1 NYN domain-containing protein [Spirochaetota bacterium]